MKKRIISIDLIRGAAIVMMVMGHVGFGNSFAHWINGFHMPIFFFISGYFFYEKSSIKDTFIKKVFSIMLPYYIWGLGYYFLWLVSVKNEEWWIPLRSIFWSCTDGNLPFNQSLWFLPSLFCVEIIYVLINKVRVNHTFIVILLAFLAFIWNPQLIQLPWGLNASLVGIGFYHLGYKSREKLLLYNVSIIEAILLGMVGSVCIAFNSKVSLWGATYGNPLLFWSGAILMIFSLWFLMKKIGGWQPVVRPISYIGEHSLIYLCINQFVINICFHIISHSMLEKITVTILVILTGYILEKIICAMRLEFVLGKNIWRFNGENK